MVHRKKIRLRFQRARHRSVSRQSRQSSPRQIRSIKSVRQTRQKQTRPTRQTRSVTKSTIVRPYRASSSHIKKHIKLSRSLQTQSQQPQPVMNTPIHSVPSNYPFYVYVIGDSHSTWGWDGAPSNFIHNWLGPKLMYSVSKDGFKSVWKNIKSFGRNDVIVLCFGEIDMRCHVIKQRNSRKLSVDVILNELVRSYMSALNSVFVPRLKNRNQIIVRSVLPQRASINCVEYCPCGSIADRVKSTIQVNKKLAAECMKNGFQFADITPYYSNPDGSFDVNKSDNNVHIGKHATQKNIQTVVDLLKNIKS